MAGTGKTFRKEVFVERLQELMKENKFSVNKLSELSEISRRNINYYLDINSETIPKTDTLYNLSRVLDVSSDYLIGRTDYRNIGNKEISENTGLSDFSIEVLRDFAAGGYSRVNIWMLNYILEKYRESEANNQITILWSLWSYIHAADLVYFGNTKDNDEIISGIFKDGKLRTDPEDNVTFYDKSRLAIHRLTEPEKLYQASVMEDIQAYLREQAAEYKKDRDSLDQSDNQLRELFADIADRSADPGHFDTTISSTKSRKGSEAEQAADDKQTKKGRK